MRRPWQRARAQPPAVPPHRRHSRQTAAPPAPAAAGPLPARARSCRSSAVLRDVIMTTLSKCSTSRTSSRSCAACESTILGLKHNVVHMQCIAAFLQMRVNAQSIQCDGGFLGSSCMAANTQGLSTDRCPRNAHQLALVLDPVNDDERLVVAHIPAQLVLTCAQRGQVAVRATKVQASCMLARTRLPHV